MMNGMMEKRVTVIVVLLMLTVWIILFLLVDALLLVASFATVFLSVWASFTEVFTYLILLEVPSSCDPLTFNNRDGCDCEQYFCGTLDPDCSILILM